MTGICRQLHSNFPAKLARLTSYHEAKPLKLLKLYLENVVYKIFHFSIKITLLNLTKIRQHNDCTVVNPKIQNHLYKTIYTPNVSQISNYNNKGPLVLIKRQNKDQSDISLSQPVFLKTMHAYFTQDIYIYKMPHFNFY